MAVVVFATGASLVAAAGWYALLLIAFTGLPDTYLVLPGPLAIIVFFAVGALGDMALRARARHFGPAAGRIWRTHLAVTAALLAAALIAGAVFEPTWQAGVFLYMVHPLMLLAHAAALMAAGLVLFKVRAAT